MILNVIEDVCYFLGVHIRLSTRCKMFHSKITQPSPQKSHECAFKVTDLWITSLLFDLNHKFINGSFAFSPCKIYILFFWQTNLRRIQNDLSVSMLTVVK